MLKVVLADDEEIIREGLATSIKWGELGFQVVGLAEDGEEAIKLIEKTHPDVVITDIKMPFVDGLKLIEYIKPAFPGIYLVIISGHDEFEYAQKAVKLGAYDYILKPIDLGYLQTILQNIKTDYEQRKEKEHEFQTLKEKAALNLPLLREQFIRDLITGKIDGIEMSAKLDELGIRLNLYCEAAIIQLDDYYIVTKEMDDQQRRSFEKGFDKTIRDICSGDQTLVLTVNTVYEAVIIILSQNQDGVAQRVRSLFEEIRRSINTQARYTVTISAGDTYFQLPLLTKSYQEAVESLNYKFILGKNRDLHYKDLQSLPKHNYKLVDYDETPLVSAIKLGDKKVIKDELTALVEILRLKGGSYLHLQMIVCDIYIQALKVLKEAGGSGEEVFNDPLETYNQIIACQTAEDMAGRLIEALGKIVDYIFIRKSNKFNQTIEKAKEYLRINYTNEDLTLEDVARHVNMSSSYLSFTFKQEAGIHFIDFLNRLRLEKAKELLMISDCKSYEVSYMVGYNNPTYFSTIFKKVIGVSPTEYKNKFKDHN